MYVHVYECGYSNKTIKWYFPVVLQNCGTYAQLKTRHSQRKSCLQSQASGYRDPWLKISELLGVSVDQAKRLTQSLRSDSIELDSGPTMAQLISLTTAFVLWRKLYVILCTVYYAVIGGSSV